MPSQPGSPIFATSTCLQVASRLAPCDLTSYPEGNVRTRLLVTSLACSCSTVPSSIVSWKWSSLPCASVQNRVQISVHSPVQSPESRFCTYPDHGSMDETRMQLVRSNLRWWVWSIPGRPLPQNLAIATMEEEVCTAIDDEAIFKEL